MKLCSHRSINTGRCIYPVEMLADKTQKSEQVVIPGGSVSWVYPIKQGEWCYFHEKLRLGFIKKTNYFTR